MFLCWLRQLPKSGDHTSASVPPPTEGRFRAANTPISPPSSFILPSFGLFQIFFSTGQVVLSTLSWYSACMSVSEGVFLMYPWREMYSTSTYSAILFSPPLQFWQKELWHTLQWVKIKVSALLCSFLESIRENLFPYHFQLLEATHTTCPMGIFQTSKTKSFWLLLHNHLSLLPQQKNDLWV